MKLASILVYVCDFKLIALVRKIELIFEYHTAFSVTCVLDMIELRMTYSMVSFWMIVTGLKRWVYSVPSPNVTIRNMCDYIEIIFLFRHSSLMAPYRCDGTIFLSVPRRKQPDSRRDMTITRSHAYGVHVTSQSDVLSAGPPTFKLGYVLFTIVKKVLDNKVL